MAIAGRARPSHRNLRSRETLMRDLRTASAAAALIMMGATAASAAPQCYTSYGGTKPNKLYLYFPPASDPGYPEFGTTIGLPPTSPAHAFNIADLTSYTGSAGGLGKGIYYAGAGTYCAVT